MKIAFLRVHKDPAKTPASAAKESSSSKGVILELQRQGFARECEEWRFITGGSNGTSDGLLPVRSFRVDDTIALSSHVHDTGSPDVIWVEGSDFPPHLARLFELCPSSLKVVYSKDWKPQKVEGLAAYDLCLVDEDWQVEKLAGQRVHAAVWDKLIDYEQTHRPLGMEKRYDICYVAYLRRRKNHELLFESMAKGRDRGLTCVCVGGSQDGRQGELEALATRLGIDVEFTGEVSKDDVNRYVNQSRLGVICAQQDAAPRALLEYMAAGVPVLANAELLAGLRYVGSGTGLVRAPGEFHVGIAEVLDKLDSYRPRAYLLEHFSAERVTAKFASVLRNAALLCGKDISLGALSASGAS